MKKNLKEQLELLKNDYFGFNEKATNRELINRLSEKDLKKVKKLFNTENERLFSSNIDSRIENYKNTRRTAKIIKEVETKKIERELKKRNGFIPFSNERSKIEMQKASENKFRYSDNRISTKANIYRNSLSNRGEALTIVVYVNDTRNFPITIMDKSIVFTKNGRLRKNLRSILIQQAKNQLPLYTYNKDVEFDVLNFKHIVAVTFNANVLTVEEIDTYRKAIEKTVDKQIDHFRKPYLEVGTVYDNEKGSYEEVKFFKDEKIMEEI